MALWNVCSLDSGVCVDGGGGWCGWWWSRWWVVWLVVVEVVGGAYLFFRAPHNLFI